MQVGSRVWPMILVSRSLVVREEVVGIFLRRLHHLKHVPAGLFSALDFFNIIAVNTEESDAAVTEKCTDDGTMAARRDGVRGNPTKRTLKKLIEIYNLGRAPQLL